MNKYQREKSKCMKKLSTLGIPYYRQKKFIKVFDGDFSELDKTIAKIEELQNEPFLKVLHRTLKNICRGRFNV